VTLELQEVREGCAGSVLVTATGKGSGRRSTAVIIAEDAHTGRSLRCDVFADEVAKIEMKTRTRTINKGDEELLEV
jgi:hypothetical protein